MKILTRIFEIIPALIAWATLILPFVFFASHPKIVTIFAFFYIFLWFLRAMEYSFFLIYSYFQYKKTLQVDWKKKLGEMDTISELQSKDIRHLIILPTYKEPISVLRDSIRSIAESDFSKEQIFLCLATEYRDQENGRENAKILEKEFSQVFGRFFWTEHPADIPGEVKGKGGNITHAGREVTKQLIEENFPIENILVTTLDADNRLHPQLISALSYEFSRDPHRHYRAFQPIPLFFNNIWDVPTINRMVALSAGFWHMIEAGRPDRLRNFSSHSQPLSALVEMDFWDTSTIVEDGRQYWRSYLYFDGNYDVTPIYLPIYQDAVLSENYFRSLVGQFKQLRRWAWGASDLAYLTKGIAEKGRKLPFFKTALQYFRLLEGHYMWATAAVFLTIITIGLNFFDQGTVFDRHIRVIFQYIFQIALWGIAVSIVLTFLATPAPPKKMHRVKLLFQWLLFPITTIFFGSLPALVTQTQMALGMGMEFNVTEKIRKKNAIHAPASPQ